MFGNNQLLGRVLHKLEETPVMIRNSILQRSSRSYGLELETERRIKVQL